MDNTGGTGGARPVPRLALWRFDAEDAIWITRLRRIQKSFPLATGFLVLGGRALCPARSSRQQLSDDARSDVDQSSGATGEHLSGSNRRDSRRRGAALRANIAGDLRLC